MNKSFLTISKSECLVVYKELLHNANQKWDAGVSLAKIGHYGTANSLMVISVEELIKALILSVDGIGFEFRRTKGIDIFFKSHEIRHTVAYIIFAFSFIGGELLNFLTKAVNDKVDLEKIKEEIESDFSAFTRKYKFWVYRKIVELNTELTWYGNIETLRQDGFYCDYKNILKTPSSIDEKGYNETAQRLAKVRSILKEFMTFVENSNFRNNENIVKLRRELKKNNYYKGISNTLLFLQRERVKPLIQLQKNFRELISKSEE